MENEIELVTLDGEQLIDSRIIAEKLGIKHRHLTDVMIKNKYDIESSFGLLLRETAKPNKIKGGRPERYYLLNEDQAIFSISLSRNTLKSVQLKAIVVKAFAKVRKKLADIKQEEHILSRILLDEPMDWERTFGKSFFQGVLALYGYVYNSSKGTASFVGDWINKHIYNILLKGLPEHLKNKRREYCGNDKSNKTLHQFLTKFARVKLRAHIDVIQTFLDASNGDKFIFDRLFDSAFGTRQKQLDLSFEE